MTDQRERLKLLKEKWFFPIAVRIEAFENASDIFGEFARITLPESPDWVIQCAWRQMAPFREVAGIETPDGIRTRHVGAMVGSKASICKRLAGGNLWFNRLPSKRQNELEKLFGAEAISEARATWSKFATEIQPEFKKLRRFALNLTAAQEMTEQVQFFQGFSKGLTLMDRVSELAWKKTKRGSEYGRRSVVCLFAIEHGEIIEAAKRDISWADLISRFDEEYGEGVEIDEDTFKKILQRSGLSVGKVGRPKVLKSGPAK
jgi:hypothetical protein